MGAGLKKCIEAYYPGLRILLTEPTFFPVGLARNEGIATPISFPIRLAFPGECLLYLVFDSRIERNLLQKSQSRGGNESCSQSPSILANRKMKHMT